MFWRRKHPVPYVFFAMPAFRHPWPTKAACFWFISSPTHYKIKRCLRASKPFSCWSPNIPEIGVPWSFEALRFPYISALEQTFGSAEIGIPKKLQRSSSHSRLLILKSIVRDAFDTSVTWFPVNFHKSHESTVPTIALPSRNLDAFRGFSNLAPENSISTHEIQIMKDPCLFWVHYP